MSGDSSGIEELAQRLAEAVQAAVAHRATFRDGPYSTGALYASEQITCAARALRLMADRLAALNTQRRRADVGRKTAGDPLNEDILTVFYDHVANAFQRITGRGYDPLASPALLRGVLEGRPGPVLEAMAAAEHKRWAGWQRHVHGKCAENPDGSLTMPARYVAALELLIDTPYADLSEEQKQNDRNEVQESLRAARAALDLHYGRGAAQEDA